MAVAITSLLFLGPPEDAVYLQDLAPVTTASEAYHRIREGMGALLPSEDWDTATEVLRRLGCSEFDIYLLFRQAGKKSCPQ